MEIVERIRTNIVVIAAIFLGLFLVFIFQDACALDPIQVRGAVPGVVQSGAIDKGPTFQAPETREALKPELEKKPSGLGAVAEKIKFKLVRITIEGNCVYTEQELKKIYKDKLNKTISIAELQGIVQDVTNYYRNNGYILTRAILPPQHVANGIVKIRVIEGYIDQVKVVGCPIGARWLLKCYGQQIASSRPLQIKVMERYLLLSNEIPGMTARAVLEPSASKTGASDLNLVAEEKVFSGYISYDNYGTLYIGPQQITVNGNVNSIFRSGDSTHFTEVRTTRPKQLQYYDLSHDTPIGCCGLRLTVGGNKSLTRPGLNLEPLKINGDAVNYYTLLQYPLIRTRDKSLTAVGGFNYIDSTVLTLNNILLYSDHIRSVNAGLNYSFADKCNSSNTINAYVEKGLPILGASTDPYVLTISRFGADGVYTKGSVNASRLQVLYKKLSGYIYVTGQYSFNPLLAAAQFAFGGSQAGRGYDPAEIIGDRGVGGILELRLDFSPEWCFLQHIQPYIFYDGGMIWNIRNVITVKQKQSITSTGGGIRFSFNKYLSGNLMMAQPLTKQIAAEQIVGRGRKPRGFFSIVASI